MAKFINQRTSRDWLQKMLKFKYVYTGTSHFGFARRHNVLGSDRYLIVLPDGITLTIAQVSGGKVNNENIWYQVPKVGEVTQPVEFIQILGAALRTAKEF